MRVCPGAPLAPLTTLGIGGPAGALIELDDATDFPDVVAYVATWKLPPVCLAGGSNIIVADAGYPGPVLHLQTHGITVAPGAHDDEVLVTVEAGHRLQDLVDLAIDEGLVGIETLTGIPGSSGATPIQNVGAYGQEIADTLVSVTAWDWQTERMVTLSAAECQFGHRTSRFKRSTRWTLLTVTLALRRSPLGAPIMYRQVAEELDVPLGTRLPTYAVADAVLAVRRTKGMVLDPKDSDDPDSRSVGSVFLSPTISPDQASELRERRAPVHDFPDGTTRVSASWLLHETGFQLGQPITPGIRISHKHYTLVAEKYATSLAFDQAASRLQQEVLEATGVLITPEPDPIGLNSGWHAGEPSDLVSWDH